MLRDAAEYQAALTEIRRLLLIPLAVSFYYTFIAARARLEVVRKALDLVPSGPPRDSLNEPCARGGRCHQ